MDIEEVFVARIACGGHICAREEKMLNFREGISGTASMTKSTSERESIVVDGLRSSRIVSDSDCVMRCFETSLASNLSKGNVLMGFSGDIGEWNTNRRRQDLYLLTPGSYLLM